MTTKGIYRGGPAQNKVVKIHLVILEATICGLGKTTAIKNYIAPAAPHSLNLDDCLVMWTPIGGDPEVNYDPRQMTNFYIQPWSADPFINQLSKEVALVSHFMGYTKAVLTHHLEAMFKEMVPGEERVLTCTMSRHIPRSAVCFFYNHMSALFDPISETQVKILIDCLENIFDFSLFASVTVLDLETCGTFEAICQTGHQRVYRRGRQTEVDFFKTLEVTQKFYRPAYWKFQGQLLVPSTATLIFQSPDRDELSLKGQPWTVLKCTQPGVTGPQLDASIKELCLRWQLIKKVD
nr:ORF16 [Acipenserid herpesvirus 1]